MWLLWQSLQGAGQAGGTPAEGVPAGLGATALNSPVAICQRRLKSTSSGILHAGAGLWGAQHAWGTPARRVWAAQKPSTSV